jgi:hypothetical protein
VSGHPVADRFFTWAVILGIGALVVVLFMPSEGPNPAWIWVAGILWAATLLCFLASAVAWFFERDGRGYTASRRSGE